MGLVFYVYLLDVFAVNEQIKQIKDLSQHTTSELLNRRQTSLGTNKISADQCNVQLQWQPN